MQSLSKQDMAKAAGAVALILLALFVIIYMYNSSQPHVTQQIYLPVGSSEKAQEMKRAKSNSPEKVNPGNGDSPSDNIDPSKFKH